ncbi:DarT ssDNA thymidine ADP-ribosyltransferase family protein [Taibaiella chishuiensis]|uniref:Uncharacterized protein DUF4433 n=1 Tax=Taibaiella chishuiensis TaxID=1434707 RepID=A0A2P8D333_9BACT|nr:DarT ssDNA thymidine ADP-ribosyltransferase family protein [Taibaiella chishuiensis]PSK91586.1 uncharacterized protein DUF4433 [Taibaiella chishuiensis]
MSLKPITEKIFKDFTNYNSPEQAVTQMASLGSLSGDLYQDSKRFIYELLQNADDSSINHQKIRVVIQLFGDNLVVAHTGKKFDERDVRGISGIADGTKKKANDKTGYKGIGFKAVFGQSEKVTIYSDGEYFRFDTAYEHEWNQSWQGTQEDWEVENDRKFNYPWPIIPIYTEAAQVEQPIHKFLTEGEWNVATIIHLKKVVEITEAITELSQKIDMYLFLKNINKLEFNFGRVVKLEIIEEAEHNFKIKSNGSEQTHWLKKTIELVVPDDLRSKLSKNTEIPDKIKSATKAEIVLAAKLQDGEIIPVPSAERRLYAYLPTEERGYHFPVLVNAAFYMVANRESLHKQNEWNQWLFENIPRELLNWVAELVFSEFKSSVYQLLPTLLENGNDLTAAFNKQLGIAKTNIPFILSRAGTLLRAKEALIDFTFLSEKAFVGAASVCNYMSTKGGFAELAMQPLVQSLDDKKLKSFGVNYFDWSQVPNLLADEAFAANRNITNNKELILHLKRLSENEKITDISNTVLSGWPFMLDLNLNLRCPKDLFFPAPGEEPDPESRLFFIHPDIDRWTQGNSDVKNWLESLGIVEKSDVTFLEKSIIPNAEIFVTQENALKTIQDIFNLFEKGDIGKDTLAKLTRLKLLTIGGSLLPAKDCFLSDDYHPTLKLQSHLDDDIFVSIKYITESAKASNWRSFFTSLGVKDAISRELYSERLTVFKLRSSGIEQGYFDQFTDFKQPFTTKFSPFAYRNIATLFLLHRVNEVKISKVYWENVINSVDLKEIQKEATAYWGRTGYPGADTGDDVPNYISWYVRKIACLPASDGTCRSAEAMLLNIDTITKLAGEYLPVFDGPELDADWRSFFKFRTKLELADYLLLLTKIGEDPDSGKTAQQQVFEYLLESFLSYNEDELASIKSWSVSGMIADESGNYRSPKELHYYLDGDSTALGAGFTFAYFSVGNQRHDELEKLLALLQVKILKQSEFVLDAPEAKPSTSLAAKLKQIIPYWAKWRENEKQSGYEEMLSELEISFKTLEVFEAEKLNITHGDSWRKKVSIYFASDKLYVVTKWTSAKVIFSLSEKLCELAHAKKHQNQLTFLLNSDEEEIIEYFTEEGIGLPPTANIEDSEFRSASPLIDEGADLVGSDYDLTHREHKDYHVLWEENVKQNATLIAQSGNDPKTLLYNGLKANCPKKVVCIFHFSHLENAVSIIKEGAIKSRHSATFKDSAGSGIISQTDDERKTFARFYFRGKTPTQYYVENLGRAEQSIARLGSDPICPVPIFFIISLENVIDHVDWSISLGSLASPNVEFGNDFDLVSKFDFEGVYKDMPEIPLNRFLVSAHQEFLIKDQLNLNDVKYLLGVQNESAKRSLLALLDDNTKWEHRIRIIPSLYNNENPKVNIEDSTPIFAASLSKPHKGQFILQHTANRESGIITDNKITQSTSDKWVTTTTPEIIKLVSNNEEIIYKLFYHYKGNIWLTYTNSNESTFDILWIKNRLKSWMENETMNIEVLLSILKQHPVLAYLYAQKVGGPDGLTLEQHTIAVLENYLNYFSSKQKLFSTEHEYLICLALHDIGKPVAIGLGNKDLQHQETLKIIDDIMPMLPYSEDSLEVAKKIIDGDPLGRYLNPHKSNNLTTTIQLLNEMAQSLNLELTELFPYITIFYQCDAAGYQSLRDRIFLSDDVTGDLVFDNVKERLLFKGEVESNFAKLESLI